MYFVGNRLRVGKGFDLQGVSLTNSVFIGNNVSDSATLFSVIMSSTIKNAIISDNIVADASFFQLFATIQAQNMTFLKNVVSGDGGVFFSC